MCIRDRPLALAIERSKKYKVIGFDISEEQVRKINNKECPVTDDVAEKDLNELNLYAISCSVKI